MSALSQKLLADHFYNTIGLEGKALTEAQEKALTQEQRILRWFMRQGEEYACGPSVVHEMCFDFAIPLTSVRRALTTLVGRDDLVKLGATITGTYGMPEHLWTVAAKWSSAAPSQGELL